MALRLQGQTGPAEVVAPYVPGPQNPEERCTLEFLNAITAEALPEFEWHRQGPGWIPVYRLLLKELPAAENADQQKDLDENPSMVWAEASRMGDDTFARLARAFKMPTVTDSTEIINSKTPPLTMFFSDASAPWMKDGLHAPCVHPGHPFVHGGATRYLNATQTVELGEESFQVVTGNLAYLANNWAALKNAVDIEFGLKEAPVVEHTPATLEAVPVAV